MGALSLPAFTACSKEEPVCRRIERMGPVTGPDLTTTFKMEATDLGIPVTTPDGRILFIFGDTFEEAFVPGGNWRSPVGLFADPKTATKGLQWTSAVGGDVAEQLVDYAHDDGTLSTILPADAIVVGDTIYLWVMVNAGLGNVLHTEIWTSKDSGETWDRTKEMFEMRHMDGRMQQCTWALDDDGKYVTMLTTGFQRDKPAIAARVPADRILEPEAYEVYQGDGKWGSDAPVDIIPGKVGEMCLRRVDSQWMLTWFNAGEYRVDALRADEVVELADAKAVTLIHGGEWEKETDDHMAQLYGPYIIPGSSMKELHLVVSQWNTAMGWPYHVEQFKIQHPFEEVCE